MYYIYVIRVTQNDPMKINLLLFSDRISQQTHVHHNKASHLFGKPVGERLYPEKEQMVDKN